MGIPSLDLKAVLYRKDEFWLAHCLELDIVAQAREPNPALASLVSLCDLQVRGAMRVRDKVRHVLTPAPREFWALWFDGKPFRTLQETQLRELIRHPHEAPYPLHTMEVRQAEAAQKSAASGLARQEW
jgi:hypothetical protein